MIGRVSGRYPTRHPGLAALLWATACLLGCGSSGAGGGSDEGNGDLPPTAPIGVVIGDSIAEGHPLQHSRLHPGGINAFDPTWFDRPGQIPYHLARLIPTVRWINHGIGSHAAPDVWNRWSRDVLGEQQDPNDGRGDRTLPKAPAAVVVICGANDIARGVSAAWTKSCLTKMAASARDHGILAVFLTVGPADTAAPDRRARAEALNDWMLATLPAYGAFVVDWYHWAEDPSRPGSPQRAIFYDGVHPNAQGYEALAGFILDRAPALRTIGSTSATN